MTEPKRLRPFFKYFGSKWSIARTYPKPEFDTIIEPFAGSAGYSLHYHWKNVVLYDADPVVCGVWDYLIRASEGEIMSLPLIRGGETIRTGCKESDDLIGFCIRFSPTRPGKVGSAVLDRIASGAAWDASFRERIARQASTIRHWKVECRDAMCMQMTDASTYFVDPPYIGLGKLYAKSNREINFSALAEWCRNLPGQVIVCECEGADWLPFRPHTIGLGTVRKPGVRNRPREAIWTNR